MMNLSELTQEEVEAWQTMPVTKMMKSALAALIAENSRAARDAYWAGKPWDRSVVDGLRWAEQYMEDFFEASADDLKATMEAIDERQRDSSH